MPRRKLIPTYRHHKPSDRAVCRVEGRDVYLGRYGSVESRERYARLIADLAAGRRPSATPTNQHQDTGTTIAELVEGFTAHAARTYTASNEAENFRPILLLLLDLHASTPTAAFTPRDLKRIRERLIAQGRVRSAVNRHTIRLRTIFRWGVAEGLVPPDVAAGLSMVRGLRAGEGGAREGRPVPPVPLEFVEAVLPHLAPTLAAMVELQLFTGARPGEVCAMRPSDLDMSGPVWWYTPAKHKTAHRGKVRRIPLIRAAQEIVKPFLLRHEDSPLFSPREAHAWCRERRHRERETPLSCGNVPGTNRRLQPSKAAGLRYTAASYSQAIGYACLRAFPHPPDVAPDTAEAWRRDHPTEAAAWDTSHRWRPNQIRHLVATEVRRRFGLEAARIVCGHATSSTTEVYYAEANADQAAEYLDRLQLRQVSA